MAGTQKKNRTGWLKVVDIVFFVVFLVMASAIVYGLVSRSGWYRKAQAKKRVQELLEKVKDTDGIARIEIDSLSFEVQVLYDVPKELFDDIECAGYLPVAEEEKQREIFASDKVMVVYKDGSQSNFSITEEGEIYWNYLKIDCPSLAELYSSHVGS